MNNKLTLSLAVLVAAVVAVVIYHRSVPETSTAPETKTETETLSQTLPAFEALKNKDVKSVVILAANTTNETSKADRLISQINEDGTIKVLAYEIFNPDCNLDRLLELAHANGEPDSYCVNGQLVEADKLIEHLNKTIAAAK